MFAINTKLLKKILTQNNFEKFTIEINEDTKDPKQYQKCWKEIIESIVNPWIDNSYSVSEYFKQGHIKALDKFIYTTLFDAEHCKLMKLETVYNKSNRSNAKNITVHSKKEFLNSDILHKELDIFECEVLLPHSLSKLYFDVDILQNSKDTLNSVLINLNKCIGILFDFNIANTNLTYTISHTDRTEAYKEKDSNFDKKSNTKKESYHILVKNIKINNERRHKLERLMNRENSNRSTELLTSTWVELRMLMPESCDPHVYNDIQAFRLPNRSKGDGHYKKALGYVTVINNEVRICEKPSFAYEDFLVTEEGTMSYDHSPRLTIDKIKLD
jgi:hypothetical protein